MVVPKRVPQKPLGGVERDGFYGKVNLKIERKTQLFWSKRNRVNLFDKQKRPQKLNIAVNS